MLISMTGFSRHSFEFQHGVIEMVLKSVNHRFFEFRVFTQEPWVREMEIEMKKRAKESCLRGFFELSVTGQSSDSNFEMDLQHSLEQATAFCKKNQLSPPDLLGAIEFQRSFSFGASKAAIAKITEQDKEIFWTQFQELLHQLASSRAAEGLGLKQDIQKHLAELLSVVEMIVDKREKSLPIEKLRRRSKLESLIKDLEVRNPERLDQEIAILLDKSDIEEECSRLQLHIQAFQKTVSGSSEVEKGKRLDFLCQEMHREMNTLGTKSSDIEINHLALDGKALIEKIKEQVQNVL